MCLQFRVMPKSHYVPLKYVQPGVWLHGHTFPLSFPAGLPPASSPGPMERGQSVLPCRPLPRASVLALHGREALCRRCFCFLPVASLCSIKETASSHHSSSLSLTSSYCAFGAGSKSLLVISVSYKQRPKQKKLVYQESLFPRKIFSPNNQSGRDH